MKINNILIIFVCIIYLFFIIPPASALTATSSNYSVSMFGTGMVASNASSTNYNSTTLSITRSTGNAQSSLYQGIIGFFGKFKNSTQTSYEVIIPVSYTVAINGTNIVQAGNVYSVTIEIINSSGEVTISSTPKITIYDPLKNLIVSDVPLALISDKKYQYNFTTNLVDVAGIKETYISIGINDIAKQYNHNWTLSNAYTEISINSMNVASSPIINANVIITNEGSFSYEYPYEYCIVSTLTQQCGNSGNIAYGSGYKLLTAGQSWNPTLSLNIAQSGNYWFKIVAHYGTQNSGATKSFSAIYTPAPAGGTSGSGGSSSSNNQPTTIETTVETTIDIQESTTVSEQQIVNGVIAQLETGEKVTINFQSSNVLGTESHTITMSNIGTNSITIVIASNPITLQLLTGKEKEIDIDGDGIKDIYFKLNKIDNGKADLIIRQVTAQHPSITGETINYPEHLMDVSTRILDEYKIINPGDKVLMEVTLYNLGTEEIKDVRIRYCIETSNRTIIKCSEETVAIYTKLQLIKDFLISTNTDEGEYFIKTEVIYDNDIKISSETNFEVKYWVSNAQNKFMTNYLSMGLGIVILIILTILITIIVIYRKRRIQKEKYGDRLPFDRYPSVIKKKVYTESINNIRKSKEVTKLRVIPLETKPRKFEEVNIGGETYLEIKPRLINNIGNKDDASLETSSSKKNIFLKLKEFANFLWNTHKIYPKNSVTGLINKKVYSESGNEIGEVKEVILNAKGIEGLKIKLDKKYKFKAKGIIVSYKHVKSVDEIIIIDKDVLNSINEKL